MSTCEIGWAVNAGWGLATDYRTLQDKMSALYRATSIRFDKKTQQRLVVLPVLIVVIGILSIAVAFMTR